jgi:creatinine amidohydrolase/Fe(II)-dependent formamide hydrolase-like protein/sterol desaturase/sphingolipid hydroxylase (fatty acid hydroxylase superfamily)
MPSFANDFMRVMAHPLLLLGQAHERYFYAYLATSFLIALFLYVIVARSHTILSFFSFAFPKSVYLHPSAILDYKYFYSNTLLEGIFVLPAIALLTASFGQVTRTVFYGFNLHPFINVHPLLCSVLYTIVLALAYDFGLYFGHFLAHRVPWIWEFHKVHHAAETLTPFTVARMHPVDDLISMGFASCIMVLFDTVFRTLFGGPIALFYVFGLNFLFFLFYAAGYNLRHSHIWVDYGQFWDRILISPAQHQIHHSIRKKHWDKNMGFILSIWDGMFGTLYVPKEKEEITFGLNKEGEHKQYSSLTKLYFLPFLRVLAHFRGRPKAWNLAILILIPFAMAPVLVGALDKAKPRVFMEDLTSTEVQDMISHGFTKVLVPTGGIEQGGAHLALGKHNFIVKVTSEKIALRLGHTLVAPVIPFSPAGDVSPPTKHMRYAGTITLSEPVFEAVVESVARSLKQHGFKEIYLLGDHGGAQKAQQAVADKLSKEWQAEGVKVIQLDDYYSGNGQFLSLRLRGLSGSVGSHASIADTSEMLCVDPDGVRMGLAKAGHEGDGSGIEGDPKTASKSLGEDFIEMKVRAAVQEILESENRQAYLRKPLEQNIESGS